MGVKVSLVTTTRADMFDVSRKLFNVLDHEFLVEKDKPVVIGVSGSIRSGKKIVADAMRAELLGSTALSRGREGRDEFWAGEFYGRPVEFDYIDIAFAIGYQTPELNNFDYIERRDAFLRQRKHGGITVIQNNENRERIGLDIWVESRNHGFLYTGSEGRKAGHSGLAAAFNSAASTSTWTRYLEIEVMDERLLASGRFMMAVAELSVSAARLASRLLDSQPLPDRPYFDRRQASKPAHSHTSQFKS